MSKPIPDPEASTGDQPPPATRLPQHPSQDDASLPPDGQQPGEQAGTGAEDKRLPKPTEAD